MGRLRYVVVVVVAAAVSTGCATAGFKAPIAEFQAGVGRTSAAVAVYYAELNSFERDLYLQERELNPELTVDGNVDGRPTPLSGVFPVHSIKARTDAIDLLGTYGKRLAALAGSPLPAEIGASLKATGESFGKLSDTFATLTESDRSASKYTGPIAALVGIVAQSVIENQRDALLTDAVKKGDPAVNAIITLLEADLREVIQPLRLTGTRQALSAVVNSYNERRKTLRPEERKRALDEIRRAQERYDATVLMNPAELMQTLRDAHGALLKYAVSHRTAPDAAELAASLDIFAARAEAAAREIARLRELRRGGS